jgi:glycosyltransferase involved in cell wall biosynthesis
MKILMLGRSLPLARRGGRATREQRFARHLARNHRLTLAFVTDDPNPVGAVSALREEFGDLEFAVVPRGWKTLAGAVSLATGDSCTLAYARSSALATRLRDRLRSESYDLIYVSSSCMIQYALEADPAVPVVIDLGDVDSRWWSRQARERSFPGANFYRTEAVRLHLAEKAIARRASRCIVSSPHAARAVELGDGLAPVIIRNGVDVDYFIPALRLPAAPVVLLLSPLESDRQVAAAAEFCRTVVPAVRRRLPTARFLAVGGELAPSAAGLSRLEGVEVVSAIADIRPYLHRATLGVAPLPADGELQTSILEAMCSGLPVITTTHATEGLGVQPGRDLLVEDVPAGCAARVAELLASASLRAELGGQAAAFVRANYSWDVAVGQLAQTLDSAVPGAVSRGNGGGVSRVARADFA